MCGFNLKDGKRYGLWRFQNYWNCSQSAYRLGGADYSGLDMLNIKIIHSGSSDVCQWRLTELLRRYIQGRHGDIVSKWI